MGQYHWKNSELYLFDDYTVCQLSFYKERPQFKPLMDINIGVYSSHMRNTFYETRRAVQMFTIKEVCAVRLNKQLTKYISHYQVAF